jgi:hypothetical protein
MGDPFAVGCGAIRDLSEWSTSSKNVIGHVASAQCCGHALPCAQDAGRGAMAMLKIREEQVGHLTPVTRRSLRDRLVGHAREELGTKALAPDAHAQMDTLLAEALDMGLSWETQIAAFALLKIARGDAVLTELGYAHNSQAPKAEIAEAFEAFLTSLSAPIWATPPR